MHSSVSAGISLKIAQPSRHNIVMNRYTALTQWLHHPMVAAVLALLIYGLWAACVNLDHGVSAAVRAGLGQGVYAFVATLLIASLALNTYRRLHYTNLALVLAFLFSVLLMVVIPLSVHTVIQTPDKWQAMSLGLVWGLAYIVWLLGVEWRKVKRGFD